MSVRVRCAGYSAALPGCSDGQVRGTPIQRSERNRAVDRPSRVDAQREALRPSMIFHVVARERQLSGPSPHVSLEIILRAMAGAGDDALDRRSNGAAFVRALHRQGVKAAGSVSYDENRRSVEARRRGHEGGTVRFEARDIYGGLENRRRPMRALAAHGQRARDETRSTPEKLAPRGHCRA